MFLGPPALKIEVHIRCRVMDIVFNQVSVQGLVWLSIRRRRSIIPHTNLLGKKDEVWGANEYSADISSSCHEWATCIRKMIRVSLPFLAQRKYGIGLQAPFQIMRNSGHGEKEQIIPVVIGYTPFFQSFPQQHQLTISDPVRSTAQILYLLKMSLPCSKNQIIKS